MKKTYFLPFFTCVFILFSSLAQAASLYYILDGSGSMWGRLNGRMKIEIARDVLTRLIREMPVEMDAGLTVYGHRKKGDCNDIEQLIPLGSLDRKQLGKIISDIRPMGKTPIAETIRQAAAELKGSSDEVTMVLISDGIETCGGNPCDLTRDLTSSGLALIVHVVGLGVETDASRQLQCIASAGGGHYFSAEDADQLLTVLSTVQQGVAEKTPLQVPEPELRPETEKIDQTADSASKSIRINARGPGRITFRHPSWLTPPRYWQLTDPETGEEKGRFNGLETTLVPAGDYQVVWCQYEHDSSPVALAEVVRVKSGETVEIPLYTSLRLNLPSWIRSPKYWGLAIPETGEKVALFSRLEPFLVPAGTYDLIWRQSEHGSNDISVKRVIIEADMLNRVDVATAINPAPADWVPRRIHYWGLKDVSRSDSETWAAWFSGDFTPQLVPAGTYQLHVDLSEHGSSDSLLGDIDIAEGSMTEFKINTGIGFIPPSGIEPPYFIEFAELDQSGNETRKVRLNGSFGPMPLKPGVYRINYRQKEHGASTMTIVDSIELAPGNFVEIEL